MKNEDYLGDNVQRPYYLHDNTGFEPHQPYFIDVICSNYDIGNIQQIAINCDESAGMLCPNSTTEEIEKLFWIYFLQDKLPLLDYHYNYFLKSGGEKLDFLEWLERTFMVFKKDNKCWQEYTDAESFAITEKYLHRWIKGKDPESIEHSKKAEGVISKLNAQLSIKEIALMQFFIFKYANGKEILKGNATQFFIDTSHKSTGKLIKCFKEYKIDDNRLKFHSDNGRTDTKQLNEQVERYKHILPYLKTYTVAHSEAEKELGKLEQQ